jgi:hypothetical protein
MQRRHGFRYSPFRSIPAPILLLTIAVGVTGGVYIFDDIVREGTQKAIAEREAKTPAVPALATSPSDSSSSSKSQ